MHGLQFKTIEWALEESFVIYAGLKFLPVTIQVSQSWNESKHKNKTKQNKNKVKTKQKQEKNKTRQDKNSLFIREARILWNGERTKKRLEVTRSRNYNSVLISVIIPFINSWACKIEFAVQDIPIFNVLLSKTQRTDRRRGVESD